MTALAGAIGTLVVRESGPVELLKRLSDPFWFQAFGCVLGMDWHSSGITANVCGALREATKRRGNDLGIVVCGGKGAVGRKTMEQIQYACDRSGDPAESLAYASRMTAKVDSAAVQDGYELSHHSFLFVPGTGAWCVIQQGLNSDVRHARRYHWYSERLRSYVHDPHAAVACDKRVQVLNLVAGEGDRHRQAITAVSREHPDRILREIRPLLAKRPAAVLNGSTHTRKVQRPHPRLATRHLAKPRDLNPAALKKVLLATHERQATEFEQLLGEPSIGAQMLRTLSQVAELLYNTPACRRDPAAHGFVHGNRDGYSYRLHRRLYDVSIECLRDAVLRAKLSPADKAKALKSLATFVTRLS
jgi:hypothetical protein